MHFTLKTNPLKREDLDEFVARYRASGRNERRPTWSEKKGDGRWRAYDYAELTARDKCSLDIFWLRDESLEASDNRPPPGDHRPGDLGRPARHAGAVRGRRRGAW